MLLRDARNKLRALGLKLQPEVVREAVQRLRNGESLYKLHSGDNPLLAKATTRKIKSLLDEGNLGFLFEIQPDLETVRSAVKAVGAESGPEPFHKSSAELVPGGRSFEIYPGVFQAKTDAFLTDMFCFDWNIEHLESIGIPSDEALSLLVEHGILLSRWPRWGDHPDLRRYLEICSIAVFCQQEAQREHGVPYEFIKLSAVAWARGLLDHTPFLLGTSLNILSYQVWRGPQFLEAFNQAQVATHRAASRLKKRYEELIVNMSIQFQADTDTRSKEQADG